MLLSFLNSVPFPETCKFVFSISVWKTLNVNSYKNPQMFSVSSIQTFSYRTRSFSPLNVTLMIPHRSEGRAVSEYVLGLEIPRSDPQNPDWYVLSSFSIHTFIFQYRDGKIIDFFLIDRIYTGTGYQDLFIFM